MAMQIKKAERKQQYLKLGLIGPSNSGKSYSALLLGQGIAKKSKSRIGLINTEKNRGEVYADSFDYDILELDPPYSPERYIEAIEVFISQGYKIVIIDSVSHEWIGEGGILDTKSKMDGVDMMKWNKLTPRHNKLIEFITSSPVHIVLCFRGKDEYVIEDVNGKKVPKKVGMGAIQRAGFEFELHFGWELNVDNHCATVVKDVEHKYEGQVRLLNDKDGELLYEWAMEGKPIARMDEAMNPVAEKPKKASKPKTPPKEEELKKHREEIYRFLQEHYEDMPEESVRNMEAIMDGDDIEKMKGILQKAKKKYEKEVVNA